jgi:protein-S-isoprenylcysteine O-methyltransferase Ste14
MRRSAAAAGSAFFFLLAPGVVAGLVPWWLTGWRAAPAWPASLRGAGVAVILVAAAALVSCFVGFVLQGAGTPAPVAPTARLVIGGLYRHVRNPMYLSVLALVAGQALALGRPALLAYGAAVLVAVVAFVRGYEEPTLRARYGAEYEVYRREVPGWCPRLRPWEPDATRR